MVECEHEHFAATVDVIRLTDDNDRVNGYMAQIQVECSQCNRPFQFLGLRPGVDTQGAAMTVGGLGAHLAMCPQGEQPSPLDRIGYVIAENTGQVS